MINVTNWCTGNLVRTNTKETEIEAECPWCGKFGAFNVNRISGAFRCFKCCDKQDSYGANLARLIAKITDCSLADAFQQLKDGEKIARWAGENAIAELPIAVRMRKLQKQRKPIRVWHDFPASEPVFSDKRDPKWMFPKYLKNRGITREVAKKFGLRTCFEGLYAGRLILPMHSDHGKTFTARAMDGDDLRYRNPPKAGHRFMVYGLEHVSRFADIVIVEGPFDVLRMHVHGISAIGLLGKEMSAEQDLLMKLTFSRDVCITLLIDPEERRAQYKIARKLSSYFEDVRIAKLPLISGDDGQPLDPGSCSADQARFAIANARRFVGRSSAIGESVIAVHESAKKTIARKTQLINDWTCTVA